MKYSLFLNLVGSAFNSMAKPALTKSERKNVKKEYKKIMIRAKDIGSNNLLIVSYAMAAYFIAMNRKGHLTADENFEYFYKGIEKSKFTKLSLGSGKAYLSEKKKAFRRKRAKETQERKYENDWVVEMVEDDPRGYGMNYLECGVCKLTRDEGCFELAKYLCKLDFLLADAMGLTLTRTSTLAEGGSCCDFRYKMKERK